MHIYVYICIYMYIYAYICVCRYVGHIVSGIEKSDVYLIVSSKRPSSR